MAASSAPANPAAFRTVLKTAGPSLLLNVVCPWAAFQILTAQGVGAVPAVAATTVFPILGTVVGWVRSGRPDVFGLLTLLLIVLSVAVAFAFENPLVILLRGSISDAALALLCVGTLAFGKPLMFYAARQLVAGWDRAASAAFDARWEQPAFRQAMRRITSVWGCWFAVQTIGRVVAVELLPVSIYLAVWPLISTLGTLAMISWSMNYGRRGAGRRWNPAADGARLGEDSRHALDRAVRPAPARSAPSTCCSASRPTMRADRPRSCCARWGLTWAPSASASWASASCPRPPKADHPPVSPAPGLRNDRIATVRALTTPCR